MGESCAIDLRVAGSNPAGQLLIYFHNVFPVLTKTLCQHSSLVPRSHIKAFMCKLRHCSCRPSTPLFLCSFDLRLMTTPIFCFIFSRDQNSIHFNEDLEVMYQSIPSLTIPPGDPRDLHILVTSGVGFLLPCLAWGSAWWGVLNQNNNSTILRKARFFLCHLVATLFICLYMLEVSSLI